MYRPLIRAATAVLCVHVTAATLQAQVRQVNIATDATDPGNLGDTEPSIAVNPANPLEVVVVSFSETWNATTMAPVWKSSNGGLTWRKVRQIPQPATGLAGPNDQKVAFDAAGRLHIAELGTGGANQDFILRQTGAADAPLTVGASFGDDQPHLDIDRSTAGTCSGRIYSPWLNFGLANARSTVTNSVDRGQTVTNVGAGDNATFPNRTSRVAIAPNGRVFLVYKTREGGGTAEPNAFENAHFRVVRSDDCGATWNAVGASGGSVHGAGTVQTLFTTQFGNPAGGRPVGRARSSDAWIAADPGDGDIYVAYVRRDAGFAQIFVARSTDQGVTWTSTRVTDGTHHSAYPEIAVADNGAVGVLFIDFDDTGGVTNFRHRFARSFDNAGTWSDQILQSMNPAGLAGANSGFLWGDYEGLTALGHTFYGVYTGRATGRSTAQLDPIFFRDSAFATPPKLQVTSPLLVGDTCGSALVMTTLDVCNTGGGALTVSPITSSSPSFSVATPSGGYPVSIAAGSCFPFQVQFTPPGPGVANATLSIPSDDPVNLTTTVTVRASVGRPTAVTVMPDSGAFGDACVGPNGFRDLPLTINNSGSCPLVVLALSSSSPAFEMPSVLALPLTIAPGDSTALPIRFRPSVTGAVAGTVTITTNDAVAPMKVVAVTGSAPPAYGCEPPLFAAIDAAIGPTFGTGRTGNYTYDAGGRVLAPFGPGHAFGVQLQGAYMFYPRRQEGQVDGGVLYRRGQVQFGAGATFQSISVAPEASAGVLSHATLSADLLQPTFRLGVFGAKGLRDQAVVTVDQALAGTALLVSEHVLHTVDQLGGAFQTEIVPSTWLDANLVYLHRHAPGVSDTAGGALQLSRLLLPWLTGSLRLDVNESFIGGNTVGTVTVGVTIGRWSRPVDYANPVNPLGATLPRLHYELFTRTR